MSEQHPHGFADDGQRYRLESRIATGGMGEVWRATDTLLGREVAVKLLKPEFADDSTFRQRFETEARHAAALHHPGIASVFDVGERTTADGVGHPQPFLVMELVPGEPLSNLLLAGRELDPDAVKHLLSQVGEALGAAHRAGIVHRDVKPANLIVTPERVVKVTDFGIARAADGVGITRTGAVMGTPQYLSPEQAEGKPATPASDVYALGVVAFECLARRRPFEADSPVATALAHIREPIPELPASVPADLAAVVKRALSKDPAERFPDGAAFAAALRDPATAAVPRPAVVPPPIEDRTQVIRDVPPVAPIPVPTPTDGTPAASQEQRRQNPWPIVLVVLLAVALAAVLVLLLTGNDDEPTDAGTDPTTSRTRSSEPTTSSQTTETTSAPATATIDEDAYLGDSFEQVRNELSALGFTDISPDPQPNSDPARDFEVTGVSPNGEQELDTRIVVTYFDAAPEPTSDPTTTSEPPPTEPTETTPPPTEPTDTGTIAPPSLAPGEEETQ